MRIYKNGVYRDMSPEEEAQELEEQQKIKAFDKHRQLNQYEVFTLFAKQQVNTLAIDDETSLKMKEYYPTFKEVCDSKEAVKLGFKFTYKNDLYKTKQPELTLDENFPPSIHTASLYEVINEKHLGNKYDPIPYPADGNMTLEKDKYYSQDGKLYLCHNGSGQPTYNRLEFLAEFVTLVGDVETLTM